MIESNRLKQGINMQVGWGKDERKAGKDDGNFFTTEFFNRQSYYDDVYGPDQCREKSKSENRVAEYECCRLTNDSDGRGNGNITPGKVFALGIIEVGIAMKFKMIESKKMDQ